MTAPLDLSEDERSLREAVRAMIGIGSTHFNLRADYLDQLLQKLSDARAALRTMIDYVVNPCGEGDDAMRMHIEVQKARIALAGTTAPVAVPTRNEECQCGHPRYVHMSQCHARDDAGLCSCSTFKRMSNEIGVVWSEDESTILGYFEYDGNFDLARTAVWKTEDEVEAVWRTNANWRICTCGKPSRKVILKAPYGHGVRWPSEACLDCGAITGECRLDPDLDSI